MRNPFAKTPAEQEELTGEEPRLLNLYVVIDEKAKTIVGPIVHDHSPVPVTRQIEEAVNKPGTLIANSPEDFAIYDLGQVDEKTGRIYPLKEPELIARAIVLKREPQ